VLGAADLRTSVQCPRCGTVHLAAHLVPTTTPLRAVPVSPDPSARAAPVPAAVQPAQQAQTSITPPPGAYAPTAGYATPQPMAPAVHAPAAGAYRPPYAPVAGYPTPQAPVAGYGPPQPIVQIAPTPSAGYAPPQAMVQAYDATPAPPGSVDMSDPSPRADFAHGVLDVADRIDAALYGKRQAVLVVISFIVTALSWWEAESTPHNLRWTAIGTMFLALYLEVLLLARVGSFRDDSRRWSAQLVRERFSAWWEDIVDSTKEASVLPPAVRIRGMGAFLTGLAIVVLALRNVVVLAQVVLAELLSTRSPTLASIDSVTRTVGLGALGLGIALWLLGFWLARKSQGAERLTVHDNERAALAHAAQAMPLAVLDCGDPAALDRLASTTPHPLFAELLRSLAAWQPRNQTTEAGYVSSLVRKLRERMPSAPAERERPLRTKAQRFRADLVIGDAVLIEMKRGLSTSTAQKALGQVQMYADAWGKRGPILLLICGVPRQVVERHLGNSLERLRQSGVLVAVMAR
jgi:hypothetical protein